MAETAGCYVLHIYCDDPGHTRWRDGFPEWEYAGETRAECRRQAKRNGWKYRKDGTTICPACARRAAHPTDRSKSDASRRGEGGE